jgi:hypothetical protein
MKNRNQMLSKYTKNLKIVGIDFDGTLTTDGKTLCKKAEKYTKKLVEELGLTLILWTCRCDERYDYAVKMIHKWDLPILTLEEASIETKPRKLCALFIVDDRSVPGGKINWYKTYRYIKNKLKESE